MKKKILWVLVIISTIIVLGVIIMFIFKKPKKIESITRLHFSYSNGYMANAYTTYDIELKDNKYYVVIKPYLIPEEQTFEVEIDKKTIKEIINILNKYEVSEWDGFSKSDKNVLDGDSFSFWVYLEDGTDIHASGYMMWPKNYGEVRSELDRILGPLYPAKQE